MKRSSRRRTGPVTRPSRERAECLACLIVSDIDAVLWVCHRRMVALGARLRPYLEEGRQLLEPLVVRGKRDFIAEALRELMERGAMLGDGVRRG